MKANKLLSLVVALTLILCFIPTIAHADATDTAVGMYGTRGKPASGINNHLNWYYSYYTNQSYWVGWNFNTSGKTVYMVQGYLFADGQFDSLNDVDGYFGNRTEQKIRDYQLRYYYSGLSSDGVVGGDTWRHMAYEKYGTSIDYLLPYQPTAS